MIRMRTAAAATLLALGTSVAGVLATAGPAAAHVTVSAQGTATQGGFTRVAFRVPTESDSASTTKLEVTLPADTPIASVSTMPVPGWTVQVTKGAPATPLKAHGTDVTEVVTKIVWTAGGDAGIKPGQFQEFPVSMGPLPQADILVFKALQTYSDGTVVRWIEEPPADGGEAEENPAPTLKLAKADSADAPAGRATSQADRPGDSTEDNGAVLALAWGALAVAVIGAALGGLALARTRRTVA